MPSLHEAQFRHARHYRDVANEADQLYVKGSENVLRGLEPFDHERAHLEAAFEFLSEQIGCNVPNAPQRRADDSPPCQQSQNENELHSALLISLVDAVVYTGQELRFHPHQRIRWLETQRDAARITKNRQAEGNAFANLGLASPSHWVICPRQPSHWLRRPGPEPVGTMAGFGAGTFSDPGGRMAGFEESSHSHPTGGWM